MPIVRVTMAAGRSVEQKAAAAEGITRVLMQHCGAAAPNINVLFEDVELDHWYLGSDAIARSEEETGRS